MILHETPGFFGHPELDTKDLVGQVLNAGTDSSSGSTSFKYGQICCTGCTNWSKSLYMLGESWRAVKLLLPMRFLSIAEVLLCFYHLLPSYFVNILFAQFAPPDASQARSWVSPVFLHAAHGCIMPGLPTVDPGVPLLLVGNHQLLLD